MPTGHPTTRRRFLIAAASAAAIPSRNLFAQTHPDGDIDAHVHVWTPDTHRYPLAEGFVKAKDMVPPSFTPQELFVHSSPAGIGRVVLIQMSFYKFDNSYMLDCIASGKGVFSGVAIVDPTQHNVCETVRQLALKGVRGLRLHSEKSAAESWKASKDMKRLWTCAADLGVAVCLLSNPDALPAIERMCRQFPGTRVVIDHFARIGATGQINQSDLDKLSALSAHKNTYVKTSAFYALGQKRAPYTELAPMIRHLKGAFGAERLMWASDCPYQVQGGHTYKASLDLIRRELGFLNAADKSWIMRKTAEKVFFA